MSKPLPVSQIREQLSDWHNEAEGNELALCTAIARMTGTAWDVFSTEDAIALVDAAEVMPPSPVRLEMTAAIRQLLLLLEVEGRTKSVSDYAQAIVGAVTRGIQND